MKNSDIHLYYVDPFSILIVTRAGKIKKIFCPFTVRCITPIENFIPGELKIVEQVILTNNYSNNIKFPILIYVIDKQEFHFNHFEIQ